MPKRKLTKYRVKLEGDICAYATMEVEAETADEAEEIALKDCLKANWSPEAPEQSVVEVYDIEPI